MLANLYSRSSAPRVTCMARDHRTSGGLVGRPSCNTQWPPTRPACARQRHAPPLPRVPTRSHSHTPHTCTRIGPALHDRSTLGRRPRNCYGFHAPRPRARSSANTHSARPHAHSPRRYAYTTAQCTRTAPPRCTCAEHGCLEQGSQNKNSAFLKMEPRRAARSSASTSAARPAPHP